MDAQLIATIIAGIVLLVSVAGTIVPILPGSLLTVVTLLVWAIVMASPATWVAAIVGMVFAILGWASAAILTGRTMRARNIPRGPVLVGIVCAIIGMFLLPVVGIFLGFAIGLLGAEYARLKDFRQAASSSWAALKSMGLGMVFEFAGVATATSIFLLGSVIYFVG
ncbi:DUF456 domain-containing protein [Micrococcoides hystricis]|uniref:DUF456 domain-containing protein n=1 Tax=Micrococcoides hystricis TaxID=1572761 RepID=A0ABV6PCK8_9MICC